ncbi:MAG: FIST C-terminal domain-containing protein [Rhizobacter sp.]|nr:FIST C-terminal domain-containing protein [Rhizobacter sp.]
MKLFLHGHATHPDARLALALAAAQVEAQRHERAARGEAFTPTLGWLYITDHFAAQAEGLLADLRQRWPGVAWVGASGIGVAASGVEYFDEPALALMLSELPTDQFRVFSGAQPLGTFAAHTAQVHADPSSADLPGLVHDMSARTAAGYVFGGLASGRSHALHIAEGVLTGGLSGVAFGPGVALLSRVTQGCQPVGPLRQVTSAERNLVLTLDGEPALDCLLRDLKLEGVELRDALPRLRHILAGVNDAPSDAAREAGDDDGPAARRHAFDSGTARSASARTFGADTRVRHLVGLDPARRGIAIGELVEPGMQLAFCTRDVNAARRDLTRICAELREETEPEETLPDDAALALKAALRNGLVGALPNEPGRGSPSGIAGAIYVSCTGRGGPHFGAPSAELALVRHALGGVPLVGFFAAGEIAHRHLYGYTGVLTVFPRSA